MNKNKEIIRILREIAELHEIKGTKYKPNAYRKAAFSLESIEEDISKIYKEEGIKGIEKIKGIGKSIAQKIEEYLKKGKIKYLEELREETKIRQIVTHYFKTKGVSLKELKQNAKKRKIIYSRYTKPAKQLLELAGSLEKAKKAIDKVASWAKSRKLDYTIETVFKKWLELDKLKPKEVVKKPFYRGDPMVWSQSKRKWYVINKEGSWLEFAGKESEVEWKIQE
jgi:DNA polymerase/3'-5' exonuclease PolX